MSFSLPKTVIMPVAAQILLAASLGALLFVFVMQFGFGIQPCVLCLWQRVPYGVTVVAALLALIWKPYRRQTAILLALCAVAYLAGMGLAIFHTGVERHWWLGTAGCTVHPLQGGSPEDLRRALLETVMARCDEIAWSVFGLTMANLNIAGSLGLAFFAAAASAQAAQDS